MPEQEKEPTRKTLLTLTESDYQELSKRAGRMGLPLASYCAVVLHLSLEFPAGDLLRNVYDISDARKKK